MATAMTSNELCAGCFRDNEEETADLWCNDCAEPVCRTCGKVHRRFAPPHDVIDIQGVSNINRYVQKHCVLHSEQKAILFCADHDKILCRVCLSQSHKECKHITEIEKAALGIKDTTSISHLKERMTTLKETVQSVGRENETRLAKVNDEKQKADDHLQLVRECVTGHLTRIEMELSLNYDQIVHQIAEDTAHVGDLGQTLQSHLDEIDNVVQKSSECHLFHIIKHLQTTQISGESKMKEIKDRVHFPLDSLPNDFVKTADGIFKSLQGRKFQQSQVKIGDKSKHSESPRLLKSENDSIFGACCFTEDDHLVVIEKRKDRYGFSGTSRLHIYDENLSYQAIPLSFEAFDVCVYDKSNALVTMEMENCVVVVNIDSLKEGRKFTPKCDSQFYGSPNQCSVIFCSNGTIWTLIEFGLVRQKFGDNYRQLRICSVDFNGNILRVITLPNDVCDICYDGCQKFYMTHNNRNDITYTTNGKHIVVLHSSLDLREGCRIKIIGNNILLLEQESNTVYKINIELNTRSVGQKDGISNSNYFCVNTKTKQIAVTMDNGKTIKIFTMRVP